MITLITGEPGAGKSAYAVYLLQEAISSSRPVYSMGIKGLSLPFIPVPPIEKWAITQPVPEDPSLTVNVFDFPDGSVIFVDEAQKVFRPRSPNSRIPPYVTAFETHRHSGLDFFLITQHPSLVDSHIRKLVGRHFHITANWSGRKLYEWSECGDPRDRVSLSSAIVRPFSLPKSSFPLYESATLHTKVDRRFPISFFVLIFILVVLFPLSYFVYSRINGYSYKKPVNDSKQPIQPDLVVASSPSAFPSPVKSSSISYQDFVPRISTRPESAPLYDTIRVAASMPSVVGCVESSVKCVCYTDQGTDTFLTQSQCHEWLKKPPYDPWRKSDRLVQPPSNFSDRAVSSK